MANERLGTSFGSAEPREPYPLPCLNLRTLITYQFSLLLFVCLASCLPLACLHLRTLADTTLIQGCWLINTVTELMYIGHSIQEVIVLVPISVIYNL
jgi:hypothetical protein